MVSASVTPGAAYIDPYESYVIRSISKRREIEKALFRLPSCLQNALYASYGPIHIPHSVVRVLGDLAGPSLCTKLNPDKVEKLCDRILLSKQTDKDKIQLSQLRIDALSVKELSLFTYIKERQQ